MDQLIRVFENEKVVNAFIVLMWVTMIVTGVMFNNIY